jgi:hypothetical protein
VASDQPKGRGKAGHGAAGRHRRADGTWRSGRRKPSVRAHGRSGDEAAFDKTIAGAGAAIARVAAVGAVGGGTAGRVTTDRDETGYDVIVSGSSGGTTVVHLDSSFRAFAFSGERERATIDAFHDVRAFAAHAASGERAELPQGGTTLSSRSLPSCGRNRHAGQADRRSPAER